jgi:hypothetical protein
MPKIVTLIKPDFYFMIIFFIETVAHFSYGYEGTVCDEKYAV